MIKNGRHSSDNKIGIVGAHKKPESEKVVLVQFYVKRGKIDAIGGKEDHKENLSLVRKWAKKRVETARSIA